jgi:hypothetical protein
VGEVAAEVRKLKTGASSEGSCQQNRLYNAIATILVLLEHFHETF